MACAEIRVSRRSSALAWTLALVLACLPALHAAEFEVVDKLTANGYTLLKSSVEVRGLLGVSTGAPFAALDVVSTGTASNIYAQLWRNGGGTIVSSMSSTGVMMAARFVGDGSGITSLAGAGDNLGNHVATTTLQMGIYGVNTSSSITAARYQINGSTVLSTGVIGPDNITTGSGISIGNGNNSSNALSVAMGFSNTASGLLSVAVGYTTKAEGTNAVSIGNGISQNLGTSAVAVGYQTEIESTESGLFNIGRVNTIGAGLSNVGLVGSNLTASGSKRLEIGVNDTAKITILTGGNVGISSTTPAYKLVVSSGAGESGNMLVISTGSSNVIRMTGAGEIYANKLYGDGSGLTNLPAGPGDDLGNHVATTTLQMGAYGVNTSSNITAARYQIAGSTVLAILPAAGSFALGLDAGRLNTSVGINNTLVGYQAGYGNTEGLNNTAVGYQAGHANNLGSQNTFVGDRAGRSNTTGHWNSFFGQSAGYSNTTGAANTFLGRNSGELNVSGSSNTFVGRNSGDKVSSGSDNILLGYYAGYTITTGTGNIVIGYNKTTPAAGTNNHLNIGGLIYGDLSARTVGINSVTHQAALDIVSTGTLINQYAQIWRDSTGVIKASMTATGVLMAAKFVGDGSGLTGVGGGEEISVSTINAAAATPYGGVNITTNTFVNGNLGVGLKSPAAALHVQAYVAGAYNTYLSTSSIAGSYSVAVSSLGLTNVNNLVIENRASDPAAPVTGQIWLRID